MSEDNTAISYATAASSQTMYLMDIRKHYNYFEQLDRVTVGAATQRIFLSDPAFGLTPITGRMTGCYPVAATTKPKVQFFTSPWTEIVELPLAQSRAS